MRRRALLATAGSLVGAGCSGLLSDTDSTPETATPAPTTTTDRATPTTDPQTTEPTTTDEPTPTPTPTEAERQAAERLAASRQSLAAAREAYLAFADLTDDPDATLADVTAAADITLSRVTNPVREARETLDTLPDGASETQRQTADRLGAVGTMLDQGVRCQSHTSDATGEFAFIVGRLYGERTGGLGRNVAAIEDASQEAGTYLTTIDAETTADAVAAFDPVDAEAYREKRDQLRREVEGFDTLAEVAERLRDGFNAYSSASSSYTTERYASARDAFETVETELDAVAETLTALDTPAAVADTVDQLLTDTGPMATAAAEFGRAAAEGARGRRPPDEAVEAGQEALRDGSEMLREMTSTRRLLRQ